MTRLLFMDESGHDHKHMPFEVRGGVALSEAKLWGFEQNWRRLEEDCFGVSLSSFGKEAKGEKLLDRDRFRWASQGNRMHDNERRKFARAFLEIGSTNKQPNRAMFTAYGQASLEMARGVFDLLAGHDAKLFACLIRRGARPPLEFKFEEFLRKDHVFLFERFFYFLEAIGENGLIVMDESDKSLDRRFSRRVEAYFEKTAIGRNRASRIVPVPFFVSSDLNHVVQAADICMYCTNWGYRSAKWDPTETRQEIESEFGPKVARLRWQGEGNRDGNNFKSDGIVLVLDPYQSRQ